MIELFKRKDLGRKALTILALIFFVSLLHYGTKTSIPLLHDFYRRFYYFPLALAAVWYGTRGGLAASLLVTLLYLPHVFMDWNNAGRELANQLMEIALYFAFSGIIGHFSDQEQAYRKRIEESSEKLEQSFRDLRLKADQLIEIEGQLRRADRLSAMGQLSASLTHEIRNPLGSIIGTAEILRDDFPPGHPKEEFLKIMLQEANRLNQVVEDFLSFAKQGVPGTGSEMLDFGKLVGETVNFLTVQAKKAGVSLSAEIEEEIFVRGSPVQLKQVVLNLLLNALQATPNGHGVRVSLKICKGTVKGLNYRDVAGRVALLQVEDEGSGIPEAELERIFDPFYTTKKDGTGLGLAISLRIAQAHNGDLVARNRDAAGACFTLTLPIAEDIDEAEHG